MRAASEAVRDGCVRNVVIGKSEVRGIVNDARISFRCDLEDASALYWPVQQNMRQ